MRAKGISLVELVVAVAILIALAGIVAVVTLGGRGRAKIAGCEENLRQLGMANSLYSADNDDWSPPFAIDAVGHRVWRNAILAYLKSDDAFYCPSDPQARKESEDSSRDNYTATGMSYALWADAKAYHNGIWNIYSMDRTADPATIRYLKDRAYLRRVSHPKQGTAGWVEVSAHAPKWSVLYLDGHVRFEDIPKAWDIRPWSDPGIAYR